MKKLFTLALLGLFLQPVCAQKTKTANPDAEKLKQNTAVPFDKADRNNNFYDNEPAYSLPTVPLEIAGEIENPGMVDFSKFPKRSVIVKESMLNEDGSIGFVGAYRYDGYSLLDILSDRILKKNNREVFPPIIDLYVEIENAKGEKVVASWGELVFPNTLHNILIATEVMRIVPTKSKDQWPLPSESKLVIASDLITERNISSPTKITVKSYPRSFTINRAIDPLISPEFLIRDKDRVMERVANLPESMPLETLHTIFYGRGRGIHTTESFTGIFLKNLLKEKFRLTPEILRTNLITIVGLDGYRVVYSFSEVMNRNDQQELLVVPLDPGVDGGKFRIFPSCDFFSDRAVKAVSEIYIEKP